MNHEKKTSLDGLTPYSAASDDAILCVGEPPMYYGEVSGSGVRRSAAVEVESLEDYLGNGPYDDGNTYRPTPEEIAAVRNNSEFIRWEQDIMRSLINGMEDVKADRTRPMDDVIDEILRDIENGTI